MVNETQVANEYLHALFWSLPRDEWKTAALAVIRQLADNDQAEGDPW